MYSYKTPHCELLYRHEVRRSKECKLSIWDTGATFMARNRGVVLDCFPRPKILFNNFAWKLSSPLRAVLEMNILSHPYVSVVCTAVWNLLIATFGSTPL